MTSYGKLFKVLHKTTASPHSVILEHRQYENALLFESNAIAVLSSQEFDSIKRQYTKIQDAYGCLGILQLTQGTSTVPFLVTVTGCIVVGKINDSEVFRITQTSFISLRNYPQDEDLISNVRKLLNSGTFYFSKNNSFDLTLCAQRQQKGAITDNRFFWNRMLHTCFIRFDVDTNLWLLKMACGYVEIRTIYVRHQQARAMIISRLSCERAGTRFNVRGCNDDGHVANFVETEEAIYLDDIIVSYLQTRGSVPLFWEQTGVQVGSHKVKLSRSCEASAAAYNKHFSTMKKRYCRLAVVNLLSTNLSGSKEGEAMLSHSYQKYHNGSFHNDVPHIVFDYHVECRNTKNLSKLKQHVESFLKNLGFFYATGTQVHSQQKGVFRINCLDCLDRTNSVQTFFGLEMIRELVNSFCEADNQQMLSRFDEMFRQMWVNNGNEVSRMYAGTGAIHGGSKIKDGARSAARTIQSNLWDYSKQEAIDVLLGIPFSNDSRMLLSADMLNANENILQDMCVRFDEYTYSQSIRVAVGTYNVNGGKHFRSVAYKDLSLSDWLLDTILLSKKSLIDATSGEEEPVDVFAIGFQEIVDLSASNIIAASSENASQWADELRKVLSRDYSYVLLTYTQLVGVCLYIFVRANLVSYVRDLAVDTVKTGLGGATGNKGAVAIRFTLHSSSLCFVCAHFAAGQSQVNERNADFAEITKKISFPMGRTLSTHDYIFWLGDFNYRVDLDKDTIKELIRSNMLNEVLQYDQLTIQRKEGKVFEDYNEGAITFAPTYKYDLFSDDYDTSEKCRAPAWTDRVLWKCSKEMADVSQAKIIHYARAELKQSDHRPVIAVLEIKIRRVEPKKREKVFQDVLQSVGPLDGTVVLKLINSNVNIATVSNDAFMTKLFHELSRFGDLVLVRFVENVMLITFKEGRSALNAVARSPLQISGYALSMMLKSPNWTQQILREISVYKDNTIPLCDSEPDIVTDTEVPDINFDSFTISTKSTPPPTSATGTFGMPANLSAPLQPFMVPVNPEPKASRPISEPQPCGLSSPFNPNNGPPPVPRRIGAPPVPPRIGAPPVPSRE
ncbi:hypothetical protein V9T40_011310 [Parthenolecanium corni]|uniref:phosphoinositide 5-phosphatase n=1 Tax=Parthenolecanium corni TaxID=536013 RepID=A0AAN9T8Q9_9HEMI